jgi:hydrogenase-4 component F
MGLLALAAAAGGRLAMAGALLHVLGHGLAKSTTFVASGRILAAEGTTTMVDIRGLLARRPGVAIPFLVGVVALLGLPPFSLFFSEVAIVVGGFQQGLGWVMAGAVLLLLVMFVAMSRHVVAMLFGAGPPEARADRAPYGPRLPLILALSVTGVIGFVAGPFATLLARASSVLGGS